MLVELHPLLVDILDKVDGKTFFDYYSWATNADWSEKPDDTEIQKEWKRLMVSLLSQFRQRYEEELIERTEVAEAASEEQSNIEEICHL